MAVRRPSRIGNLQRTERSAGAFKSNVQRWFARRDARGRLTKVHDYGHVNAVASHARILAEEMARSHGIKGLEAKRVAALADVAGHGHDLIREATERYAHAPFGKKAFLKLVRKYPNFLELTPEEISTVADAIELHELPYETLVEKASGKPLDSRIVAQAVQIADKVFEASGFRVLERRAFFVGKERLSKDLKNFPQLYGARAPLYAVAMESCMRLRAINYLPDVEKAIQPIARPLHEIQEKFYLGLLKELGFSNELELLAEMKKVNFPKLDKMEDKLRRTILAEKERVSKIPITKDVAQSASEIVIHFASSRSPEEAIATFRPKGRQAIEWFAGIKGYRNASSEYLQRLRRQLRSAFKAKAVG